MQERTTNRLIHKVSQAKFRFPDSEREYLKEMRSIGMDSDGNEVLVGLSLEETETYRTYAKARLEGKHKREDGRRYLELHDKHEAARLAVLGAEIEMRNDKPPIH